MPLTRSAMCLLRLRAVAAICLLTVGGQPGSSAQAPPSGQARGSDAGQSVTVLPDGRLLMIGGEGSLRAVAIKDPDTGVLTRLNVSPLVPRAWHSATLLPDGSILLLGGVDERGTVIAAPERFLPMSSGFEALPATGVAPRAGHTATTLVDGRVLIVGGAAPNQPDDVEIWDPDQQRSTLLNVTTSTRRRGHSATLRADGRVTILGNAHDLPSGVAEIFDPATSSFEPAPRESGEPDRFNVAGVYPDLQHPVSVDGRFAIWFSQRAEVKTFGLASIAIEGPTGLIQSVAVPVESGRLVFVTPAVSLEPSTTYRLIVSGLSGPRGIRLEPLVLVFRTADKPAESETSIDDEDWWPSDPARRARWRSTGDPSPWQSLKPLLAPPGVTALAGQVLRLNGRPLADVTLRIGTAEARSDRTGRFLLVLPGVAGRQKLEIDGDTAGDGRRTYGFYEAGETIAPDQTNVLPYTIWMTRIDTQHKVRIPSPTTQEIVVTTPRIPGLELRLPPNTVIRDHAGKVVRELSITPIPIDRTPFPLPENVEVPIYFTVQPGGAYIYNASKYRGARFIYPNYRKVATSVLANFWHYDPDHLGWYVYGAGVVKGDQVIPNPGVSIYELTGAMVSTSWTPPSIGPNNGDRDEDGDPVDLATGLFVTEQTDLLLADVMPLSLRRTYRQNDPAIRTFGRGMTNGYSIYLWSAQQYQEMDLVMPDGGRVHYLRVTPGTGYEDAEFEHVNSSTPFYKSRIRWHGNGWEVMLRDGTTFIFGPNAPVQEIRDRFGNSIRLSYSSNRLVRLASPNGRSIDLTYQLVSNGPEGAYVVTQATDNVGRTVTYGYDNLARLVSVTNPLGGVTEYTYDASDRMLTIEDARNIVFLTNVYDAAGRVQTQTQADGTTYQFAYVTNQNGRITQTDVTNPRGYVNRTVFNDDGYPISVVAAMGTALERTSTITRQAGTNAVSSTTDMVNRRTDYTYDPSARLISVTRLAGTLDAATTSVTYDSTWNEVATLTDPLGHTTTFTRDTLGRVTTITDPSNRQTTMTYNGAGQVLTTTNALSETLQYGYARGEQISVTLPTGETTTRFFDGAGRLLRVTNALGYITSMEYDAANRVTKIVDASNAQTTFTYDANGNLLTITDPRNHTTQWTYDVMDRVVTRTNPALNVESFAYDANGNLTSWTDRKSQRTAYEYDALDRQVLVGFGASGVPPTYWKTTVTTYDLVDRPTSFVDSPGATITRTYDQQDRLTSETTPEGTLEYTFDADDLRATLSVPGQSPVTYSYDAGHRMTGITQGTANVTVTYDSAGRRSSVTLPNGIVAEYIYDSGSRLAALTYKRSGNTIGTLAYQYDGLGRRIATTGTWARATLPPALSLATYGSGNEITTWNGIGFTYDANGNLTNDGVRTFTWDPRNQLSGITGPAPATFSYDPLGRRRTLTSGGTTTAFLFDGQNVAQEQIGGAASANFLAGLGLDSFVSRTDASGALVYLPDATNSPLALADPTGALQTVYAYEPFGEVTSSGVPSANRTTFTGRERDVTGLHYYRARYYDPRLGRFVSEDPRGFNAGPNFHAYVGGDPISRLDPLGEDWLDYVLYYGAQFSAGMGDQLSFGATGWIRELMGTSSVIDPCSGWYAGGETAGTMVGAAFGGAHLGRNAINQMNGSLGRGLGRVFYDNRTWGAVRSTWSVAEGNGTPYLLEAGQHLHHWLFPKRLIPHGFSQGMVNAGFNYFPLNASRNSMMNGNGFRANVLEWGLRGVVAGMYGALVRNAKQKC